jgi:hypothetical protein
LLCFCVSEIRMQGVEKFHKHFSIKLIMNYL